MRAAPALQLIVYRFGAWRFATALLAATAAASMAAWTAGRLGVHPALCAAVAAAVAGAVTWRAGKRPPVRLRWSGSCWYCGPAAAAPDDLQGGELRVMVDLGAFLLLRFDALSGDGSAWLPVQKRGLAAPWHALRCAVYSPRLPAASVPADDPPTLA